MKISLFVKLVAITIISVLVTSTTLFFLTNHYVVQVMDDQSQARLKEVKAAVETQMDVWKNSISRVGFLVADNAQVQRALQEQNTLFLQEYCSRVFPQTGVDMLIISDRNGKIIARGHASTHGTSVRKQINVQKALEGKASMGIELDAPGHFAWQGGFPIFFQGQVVGVITAGMHLGDAFVDNLKEHFHVMATIFEGETRISTTLIRNNNRAVGTKISNPKVIECVLQDAKIFFQRNKILGKMYDTIYWPIINAQGNVDGMFFVGHDRISIESAQQDILWSVFWGSLAVAALMISIGIFFARTICRALNKASFFAAQIAKGNLDEHLDIASKDEIGELSQSLNIMANNIRDKIQEAEAKTEEVAKESERVKEAAKQAEEAQKVIQAKQEGMLQAAGQLEEIVSVVSSASEQLSTQIDQSSKGAEQQTTRVSETATAMEEMNGAVLKVARNAIQASELSGNARQKAQMGAKAVEEAGESMGELQNQAQSLKTAMTELDEYAGSISQIMGVISDIADQTNLLALNAAIEAARAGEAGRGFAVVADEVRKLAEKTMASTADVSRAITQIQDSASKSTQQVDKTGEIIEELSMKAQRASDALAEIVKLVDENADQVQAIATASEEQSTTSEEINRSITEVNTISSETSQAMREAAQAVVELSQQMQELKAVIYEMQQG